MVITVAAVEAAAATAVVSTAAAAIMIVVAVTYITGVYMYIPIYSNGGRSTPAASSAVLVFFINPIGASELTRGVSSSNLGTNPSTTPFFERGHHLSSSRWLYRTPPTLVGRLQLTPA